MVFAMVGAKAEGCFGLGAAVSRAREGWAERVASAVTMTTERVFMISLSVNGSSPCKQRAWMFVIIIMLVEHSIR